jgi:hypothetical protein
MRTPRTSRSSRRLAAAAERNEPVWRTPARPSALVVASIPGWPRSTLWLEAVEQASHPAQAMARASSGGLLKTG